MEFHTYLWKWFSEALKSQKNSVATEATNGKYAEN
jgi:hypothetical protein